MDIKLFHSNLYDMEPGDRWDVLVPYLKNSRFSEEIYLFLGF